MKSLLAALLILALTGCRPTPDVEKTPDEVVTVQTPSPPVVNTPVEAPAPSVEEQIERLEAEKSVVEATVVESRPRKPLSRADLELKLPAPASPRAVADSELQSLKEQAAATGSAAHWRLVAEKAVVLEDFSTAHQAYQKEAKIYRDKGHTQAAIAEQTKADQYATVLEFYQSSKPAGKDKLERLEPANGCYVGAFIDRDRNLSTHHFQSQTHGDIGDFNELTGKRHASFFMYRAYGHPFPREWAEYVKSQDALVHIAWEPSSLNEVYNEDYLKEFFDDAARLDHPVILRFASEMNGEWTGYNGDPEGYKKAFQHVYKASRRAPKVAMLWCPNTVPQANIKDYYPGDDYVDWVGVNFYSVPFLDNNPQRPGEKIHPTDHLRYVYDTFSKSKPIAVGEWAASHKSSLSEKDLTPLAKNKLAQLYSTLPTRYPRVKMVNWYDCNNMVHAREERQLNDFQLTGSKELLQTYSRAVANPYFIGAGLQSSSAAYKKVEKSVKLAPGEEIRLFLKSYDPSLKVYFKSGERVLHASESPLEWYLKKEEFPAGKGDLEVVVYDSQDRFVTRATIKIVAK